jgi:hypothetical protein
MVLVPRYADARLRLYARILLRMAGWSIDFEAVSATPQTGFNRVIIAFFRL